MKNKKSFAWLLLSYLSALPAWGGSITPPDPPGQKSLTLIDCYDLAKNQSEKIRIQMENITQAKSRKKGAIGSVLPNVHWRDSVLWQDTNGISISSTADNSLYKKQRTESRITVTQPVFSGFKEFSAINEFSAESRRETYTLNRSNILLYKDVAASFLNAVALETDLSNTRTTINLNMARLDELKARIRVGRSRESEQVTAESQLANLKSQEARTLGDLAVARESLSFLIGKDASHLPLVDNLEVPALIPEEEALKNSENRSDLMALREEVEANKFAIRVARADYWPGLGLLGNYYTQRLGFQKDIDWDVTLAIDVPIFQGGRVSAQTEAALSTWRQARFQLDQQTRLVVSEIKQAHASLQSSLQQAELLEDAYKKAKKGYDLLVKEYRYGLVTNLDVLQALSFMQDVKQNWDRSMLQSKLDNINLLTATESFDFAQGKEPNP